ncbi:MAG: hypothetical protein ABWZ82_05030 [Candidatus Limnocylindrales bacterium]
MARKAGPLLLIAFLLAITAGGGGGVTPPWPRSPDSPPEPVTAAQVRLATGGLAWRPLRME